MAPTPQCSPNTLCSSTTMAEKDALPELTGTSGQSSTQSDLKDAHVSTDSKVPDTENAAAPQPQQQQVPDGPPPPFAPYEPEFFLSSHGDVISHDHHLNEDGEALYRFLLDQCKKPPVYTLSINGTHKERRTRTVTRTVNGTHQTRVEHYTVTITDFDFSIDLTDYITVGPAYWTYPDETPAYRGLPVRQVDSAPAVNANADVEKAGGKLKIAGRRKATKDEIKAFKVDEHAHINEGIPPWENLDRTTRCKMQASSKTLREWADEYAASPKLLKEFLFEKSLYGWNTTKLQSAITSSIHSTSYTGTISASFLPSLSRIAIRPDNRLSRTLSRTLYKVLLWIFLIYPFIWLFKRFSSRGGGKWEVGGAAYGLVCCEPVQEGEDLSGYRREGSWEGEGVTREPRIVVGADGVRKKLIGLREGEWFREWEQVIKRCAKMRLQRDEPLRSVRDGPADPANQLEGYAVGALEGY
ncbi:unnamed protein product [Cyclocybe aegerita]|uniref:Uncharacterized protein n=1 Tax=Cyclocybe aegerita TaxID=1973307 RepID=A0A8S0VX46_CYCAE|nr:unnamed protein product [Cyclocybe aegerita]